MTKSSWRQVLFSHHKEKSDGTVQPVIFIRLAESAALSWDSYMSCVCAGNALTTILRQNGLRFPPPPFCNNVHKSGFFPPVETVIQNSKKYINLANQKRKIHVQKRSQEPRKPQFTGLLSSRVLPKKRY